MVEALQEARFPAGGIDALGARPRRPSLWRGLLRARLVIPSLLWIGLVAIAAVASDRVAPYRPKAVDVHSIEHAPSLKYLLGTDQLGRDGLSRLIVGTRVTIAVAALATIIAAVIGVTIGLVAGYARGWFDYFFMRIVDTLMVFPGIILAIVVVALLGNDAVNSAIAIAVSFLPAFARLVRGETLVVTQADYVVAARSLGASPLRLIVRHVFVNAHSAALVQGSLVLAFAILAQAGLSYLGVGITPTTPSWGGTLHDSYAFLNTAPWLAIAPGVAIFLTVLAFNFIGDALRDALDPKLR